MRRAGFKREFNGKNKDDELLFEIVNDPQRAILGNHSQVPAVRGEGEGIDTLVGELPSRDWVELLVLGMDRFVQLNSILDRGTRAAAGRSASVGDSHTLFAIFLLWREDGIFLLLVIDNERAVHV